MRSIRVIAKCIILAFICAPFFASNGQSRVNSIGTGGIHTIQGRIYLPNGRTVDMSVPVQLQSTTYSTVTVYTDHSGGFAFRSLAPGNYTIVVEGGENFETVREYITIDTELQGAVQIATGPKTVTVPIHFQMKQSVRLKNEVINAKLSSVPESARTHFERGMELNQTDKTEDAIREFKMAISSYPPFTICHTELGKTYLKAARLDDAITSFRNTLRYEPQDFDAHVNLGVALMNKKQFENAETELVTAAFINREAVTPHYYLGLIYIEKKDLDIAQKAMETAKEMKGSREFPLLHKYLGGIYMAKKANKRAVEELETYLKLAPNANDAERIKKTISDLKKKG